MSLISSTNPADFISFWEYFSTAFVPLNNLHLPLKDAHRLCCDVLQDAVLGELSEKHGQKIISVNIPPRVGKTKMMEALVTWMVAYFPDSQIIYTSYSADVAEQSLRYIAEVMRKPWYLELYGDHLHGRRTDHLSTIEGGNIYAEGMGGSLTGKGGGLKRPAGGFIVIDDPAKPDEALSPIISKSIRQWFETTIKDRRNSDIYCPIIICAQRLAPEDLPGYVMINYPDQVKVIKCPAMVDGVSQFPETISTDELNVYQRTRMGRFALASKYQQEPTSLGGNLIPTGSFYRFDPRESLRFTKRVITCDTAMKIKQANDFSCLQLWGLLNKRAYLLDQMHGKWESPELLETATLFWQKHGNTIEQPRSRLLIEEKAAGTGLIQQMRKVGIPAEGIERSIDKVQRVQAILPYIETGMVYVPKDGSAPWIDKFLTECAQFQADGTATHDDMVDCLVDGIEQLLGKPTSIFDVLSQKKAS